MIGREWVFLSDSPDDDYFLADFIQRALPEEAVRKYEIDEEDEYLSQFIDYARRPAQSYKSAGDEISQGDINILQSKFISTFSSLDFSSKASIIRITKTQISSTGMRVFSTDATAFCYTLSGAGDVSLDDGALIHCKKYDCLCIDCRRSPIFRAYPGEPWECAIIRVNGEFNSSLYGDLCAYISANSYSLLTFGAGTRFRSLIWDLLGMQSKLSPNSENLYHHLLLSLFLELNCAILSAAQKPTIIPDLIVDIQNYLDKNYSTDISLDSLAKTFNISKYHMSREFKRYIGKSPIDYLIDVRITRAKSLLYDTNRSISDICQLVGIPNANHFLYLFKEREGLTPSAFRKFKL